MTLAQAVRRYRILAGLTQEELGKAVGVTRPAIANIEAGHGTRFLLVQKLARTLGFSLDSLE